MDNTVLFVQDSSSFLINAIITQLAKENITCTTAEFEVNAISRCIDDYSYVFISVDKDSSFKHNAELVYLKDCVSSSDKNLILMGSPSDLDDVVSVLSDNHIVEKFIRPINTRDVVDRMFSLFYENEVLAERKNILVVDDSGTFLHTIREWLEPTYKITMVSSATAAISFLTNNKPDLILLDYEMPVCSGPKLLEIIHSDEDNRDIPVMFLTGKGDRESVQKVLSLHPQGYLLKSLPRNKILKTLEDFFNSLDADGNI